MTDNDIVLNEIKKVRSELSEYSNVLIKGDNGFKDFLKLFSLENNEGEINLVLFKKLDNNKFILLLIYNKEIVICNRKASSNNEFNEKIFKAIIKLSEPVLTTGPVIAKTIVAEKSNGIDYPTTSKNIDFEPINFILSSIQDAYYLKFNGNIVIKLKNIKEPIRLDVNLIRENDSDDKLYVTLTQLLKNISTTLTGKNEVDVYNQIMKLIQSDSFEQAIEIIDEKLKKDHNNIDYLNLYYLKTCALFKKGDIYKAQNHIELLFNLFYKLYGTIEESLGWSDSIFSTYSGLKELSSRINFNVNNYNKALWEINDAYVYTRDEIERMKYKVFLEEVLKKFMENFSNLDYYQRKVIYLEKNLPTFKPDTILPLRIGDVKNLVFPPSHPIKGELYVAHPFKTNYYYPFDKYEQLLFDSQFDDLNHLLQCLGATEIIQVHIEGDSESNESEMKRADKSSSQLNQKAEGGNLIVSGNIGRDNENFKSVNNEQLNNNRSEFRKSNYITRKYTPKKSPYIPSGLDWYNHNDTWVRIAQQRMQGELTYYEMIMSSNSLKVIKGNERSNITSDYKSLISGGFNYGPINGKGSHQSNRQSEIESDVTSLLAKEETKELKLKVTFAPLDQLTD